MSDSLLVILSFQEETCRFGTSPGFMENPAQSHHSGFVDPMLCMDGLSSQGTVSLHPFINKAGIQ